MAAVSPVIPPGQAVGQPLQNWKRAFGDNILDISVERGVGALKGFRRKRMRATIEVVVGLFWQQEKI